MRYPTVLYFVQVLRLPNTDDITEHSTVSAATSIVITIDINSNSQDIVVIQCSKDTEPTASGKQVMIIDTIFSAKSDQHLAMHNIEFKARTIAL